MEDNKNKTKVDLMYDDLYEQGYLEKDRDTFNKFFYAPGEQGYKNRKALYDDLHEQGYLESPTYEDFAKGIGLHAVGNAQDGASSNGAAAVSGVVTGRPDLVESLNQYGEGLKAQNTQQANDVAKDGAPSSRGGGAESSWSDGKSVVKKPDVKKPQLVRQEDLYVDEKGNPAIGGYTKDDAKAIEHSELFYPLMRNDSINVRNTEAFRKGWLTAPQYEKNRKYNEAQAAGYKAQGEKFKNLTDQQLVQAMREEEKKLDGSTSPEALQASMNVTYIETLMAAREWGLGDVAGLNSNPHMVDYHQARDYYNKNGLVDKYEKNMLTGKDDNPLLIRGWELIEEQYAKDEAEGNHHKSSYYRNLPFHDPKFAEEFGAYITARIKVTGERWNDAVKDAIDDFEAAAEEGRVGQRHSEEYLGSANREQVDDMLDQVSSALKKRTGELDDEFMNKSWFQRMGEPSLDPEAPSSRYLNDPDASNLIWAGRALQDAKKIIAAFDANRLEDGLTGFFKGVGRGLVDSLGDLSTWDGGISDLLSAQRLDAAVEKFKKGKPLSASEKALLEATSLKLATAEIFKEVGRGYKAGTVTGESLPFMVEMALNPIAKSGDKIASGLARYANKYLGKYLKKMVSKLGRSSAGRMATRILGSGFAKKAGKVAARVAGDIGAAGGMAATSGLGHSAANAIGYHTGDVQYQQGAGGKTHFSGVMGGDDWVTSTLKGFGSTTIENASEMWGEYFKPVTNFLGRVSGKALEKMHLGAITRWLNDVNSTEMARLMGDFRKQTRWDGSIAEYFEEVAGNIANALTVGDMNFSLHDKDGNISLHERNSVFNVDDNVDTFLGVSLMSGAMGAANIVGYRTPKYRAKQDVKRYGDMAKRIFGGHGNDWAAISSLIENESEETRRELVTHLMKSGKYSKAEKEVALKYAGALYKSRGIDLGEGKQKRSAGEQEASEAYGRGYNMATLENIAETSVVYNQLRAQMEKDYGSELMKRMDDEPGLVYNWVRAGAVSEEDAQKVLNYLNAKMAYDGAVDRLRDDDAAARAAAEAHVEGQAHSEENGGDGQIHPVALKGRQGDYYVVSGNVVTNDEGAVDVAASDNDIVVVDSDGNRMMTTAKDIAQVGEVIDTESAKAAAAEAASQPIEEDLDSVESGESGVESTEGFEDTGLDSDEVAAPDGATQQDASSIQAPLPVTEYNQDDLVTVEVDGQRVNGIVTNGLDDNGNVTLYLEEPINGRQNVQLTPEQLNQVAVSYTSRDGETITRGETPQEPQQPQPQQQQAPGAPAQVVSEEVSGEPSDGEAIAQGTQSQVPTSGEYSVQSEEAASPSGATQQAPAQEQPQQAPAQPSLPVGEDGNADFSNATPQEAHDYIYNDPELDEGEADEVVRSYAAGAQTRLDEAQAALKQAEAVPAPKMEDYRSGNAPDVAGYKRAKRERNEAIAQAQAAVDAAQREVDLWQGVQAQHMMNRAAANAAANREENPAAPSAPASGENENNAPTPSQATPAQGQQTTESTQEPSAPQPNEENGPMASTTPSSNEEERGESAPVNETAGAAEEELTPDERIERARMEALENRAEELAESCGLPVQVARSLDDLSDRHRREVEKQHAAGKYVNGFYDPMTKQIVLFLPDIAKNGGLRRLERTFLHEGVAHGGLRALFENAQNGIQTFDELCDQVWEMMPVVTQAQMMNYIGVQKPEDMTQEKKRIAADEYMAHLAEWGVEQSVKSRIISAVKNALRKIGVKMKLSNNDIVSLLAASRRKLNEMDKVGINSAISEALDNDGEDEGEGVRMSTTAIFEGAGLEVSRDATDNEGKPTKEPLTDSKGNLVARIGDKEFSVDNPVKAEDLKPAKMGHAVKESSVLHMLIEDSKKYSGLSDAQADKIYQNYADLLNMYLYMGSAAMGGPETVTEAWEWLGDSVFRTIAANGDAQYSYSMDIIRVCKKNEAVIKAMSALQLREGRGATPSEIVELYRETHEDGYQVPCPVCYVFTRYIRNGKYASAAIKGMEKWGDHLPGGSDVWSVDQWVDALDKIQRETNPDYKPDGKNKMKGKELEKAKRFKKQLDQANKITVAYEKRVNALSYLLTTDDAIKDGTIKNKVLELTPERRASIEKELDIINEQYQHAVEIIAHQALSNWIKTHAIEEKDGKWTMREDAKKPEDIDDYKRNALDLRLTSNTIVNYPAIQRLRKSGGSAAGKEISFASDNRLGEVVSGLGINKTNLSGYKNKYEEALHATGRARTKARNEARKRFKDATVYALMQTLRGGQRMWSWSDNIERLSPDIAINIMQLQLLGGAMQTYSKQLEGIKLAAQMGAYVNGSLMAKDNGYQEVADKDVEERDGKLWLKHDITDEVEEYPVGGGEPKPRKRIVAAKGSYVYQAEDGKKYVLIYDDVVGVDPFGNELHGKGKKKGLFQLNQEYDRAGNILVGMNDLHVRAAMADPAVFFIIPWHSSGANNHILNQMLNILEQTMTDRLDYTAMQEEKNMLERNKNTKELPEVNKRLRDLWEEGRQWAKQNKWKSGMEVDSNGDVITESQYMYRQLRAQIFNGNIFEAMPSEEQYRAAVDIVNNMQATMDELDARNEAWKAKSPEYKKSPEGKAEKKAIDKVKGKAKNRYNPALHTIELHDGLIDWRDSSQHEGDAEWQEQHPKRINVEEARRMIEADEFLSQVLKRVEPIGHMTNGDNTYIYPYEYWDESSTYDTADINGKRYVEYCRRMGYKPKFSGRWGEKVTEENMNDGNFVHDPGYWKLLIDRRMYDRNGKYQWLDPVESENFEPDLVNPLKTGEEFNITQVADDKDAEDIAERVYNNMAERDGGVAKVDYSKPLEQIMDEYDAALAAGVQANVKLTDAEEDALDDMEEAMEEEDVDSGVMFSTSAIKAPEASDALAGYEKIHPKFKLKDGVKTLERFYKEGDIESLRIYRDSYMDSVKTWERDLKKDLKTGFYETSAVIRDDRALVEKYTKLKDYAEKLLADLVWGRDDYNSWGVAKNAEVSLDELDDLFARHNDDVTNSELWNRVLAVSRRLGVDNIKFKQLAKDEAGATMGGRIRYQADYYNDYGTPDHLKTETLLHEMIHHVTSYAIRHPENLTEDQKDAVERIKEVWMDIKFDPDFKGTYGITSPSEMVAELSDPDFRDKLKSKTYWEKLIDGVLRLLGIEREGANMTTAYDVVRRNLERLLSDPNLEAYNKHAETQRQFSPRFSTSPTFYSNAERAVENIKQNKATAEQWKAMLTKAGGLKSGEDKWMGLSQWLDENKGKSLTKEEVLQFVRDNGIQMEEVNYGDVIDSPRFQELRKEYREVYNNVDNIFKQHNKRFADYVDEMESKYGKKYYSQMTPQEKQIYNRLSIDQELFDPNIYDESTIAIREMANRYGDDFEVAFSGYQDSLVIEDDEAASSILGDVQAINSTRLDYTTDGLSNLREIAFVVPNVESYQENDEVHFGPENQGKAVMWVRFGETTDADGKRVLVIDEIQSNRHQDAREKGYRQNEKKARELRKRKAEAAEQSRNIVDGVEQRFLNEGGNRIEFVNNGWEKYATDAEIAEYRRLTQLVNRLSEEQTDVEPFYNKDEAERIPSAPFEKNWHEVAMKRMLRLAAEEGFDKVAWTTGEQQAKRYSLGRAFNSIEREDNPNLRDTKRFVLSGSNMETVVVNNEGIVVGSTLTDAIGKDLSEVVGQSVAEKMMGLEDGDMLEGEDLRIGGEGMKGFYDNMLPRFMDKYGKRWGVKTGTVELPNVEEAGRTMHSVDVTPEMKESVMQGQPLFSVSDMYEPAARNTEQEPEVDGGLRFSVREKPEPKKTIPVYKLMRLGDDGKLYPLFIDGTEPIELGVWYDADSPNMDMLVDLPIGVHLIDTENGTSMTMEEYYKQNGLKLKNKQKYPSKGIVESTPNGQRWVFIEPTERAQRRFGGESRRYWNIGINGSGSVSTFSMRPGWHAGSLPTMRQIGKGAKKNLRDDRFVWVEGLISADIDYNEEAQGNPDNDIPTHIPTDGFYMKATNANAKASQADRVGWYISGAFMPVRIMSDSETRQVIDEWNQDHPDLQVEYDFPRESGKVFNAETMQLEDEAETRFSTSEAVATLKDDERVWNDLLGKVFSGVSNETRRGIVEDAMRNRGNDFGAATEAWLGGLADDGKFADVDRRDWGRVKLALHQALMDNGVDVSEPLSDGESRYVLWKAGQVDDGVFSLAEDVVMRDRLLSGAHAPQYTDSADVRFSTSAYDVIKAAREAASGEPQGNGYISSTYYHGEIAEGSNAGEKYTIRISDHPAKWDNFVYSEDEDLDGRVLSIVITDDLEYINEWKGRGLDEITDRDGYDVEQYILNADDVDTDMLTAAIENFKKTGRSYGMKDGEMIGIQESGDGIQFSVTPRDRAIARDQYERWMKSGRMQWVESMQDSMLGLKKLMQAIMGNNWTKVEDVAMYENPYIAENLMSSVTAAQQQAFYTEFMKPLLKEVSKLCKGGKKAREKAREDLTNYLMAKHGLERNQVLADRDAQETAQAGGNYQDAYAENRERDYSGLTALTGEDDVHAAEAKAQQIVDDYEAQHDTTELWSRINAATQVTLEKQYKSGMLSYAEYQRISDMFEYYVPLRGWEETTSDQVYGYLTSKAGPFLGGGIVKRAGGRSSKADDPIATIAQMGDDSIRTGNRNLMKQRFLNFVQNHPSDAVSVSDLWLKYDDVTDEWVPVFADIDPNDSPEVVEQKLQAFEQQMQQLASQEPTKYKHGREAANIPYRVIPGMEKEHQVLVKRNGQTWVLTINGNPRAAQALNGLTNPDVPMEGAWASMIKGAEWVNRTLSALYTTLSPAFIVSNFLRDTGYSNTMVWVRESPNYALRFNKNYLKLNPGTLRWLLGKWEDGTLDESKPLQKHFKEFMLNGGETGFAMVKDLDKYKKDLLNEVKNMNSRNFVRKGMKVLGSQYELLGRSIENCARFAAYMTSREMGRDVKRSAYDAKEISVNFNKKGSGGKSLGKVGQTMSGNVGALISGMARSLYTFWNAGVQGMTNAGRAVKRHPVKAALMGAGPLYEAGFLAPILAQMMGAGGDGDDDKNAYYNLPEYVRRSNLCIWLGDAWLTIPLPIEFRSIYGLGELTFGVISGNERYSDEELLMQVAGQFSQLLPIDMLEGGGGFHPFIPTLFKPIVEAEQNKSWSGLPIYRSSEWNKDDPEYTKAFSNANEWIVSGAEWLNAMTGGDEFKKGWIDLNPAKIEYMLKGYLGGIYTTIDEVRRAAETALGKRDFEWRNIPLANRVIKQGDERTESKKLRDEYFKYKEDYEETKHLINKYKNAENTDLFDYAKKLDLLNNSKEYGRYLIFEKYATMLEAYQKAKKGASGEVLKKIEEDEKALMRQLVDEMHAFEDGKITVGNRPKLSKKDRSEDYGYMYNKLRTYVDINEDALLDSALKRAKAADDKGLVAALNSIKRSISEMKKGLGRGKDEEVMNSIRQMRNSVLQSFGIIGGGEEEPPEVEEQWQEEPQEDWGDEGNADFDEPIEPYPDDEDDEYDY